MSTGSSIRDASPKYRRGIQSSWFVPWLTTRTSDQLTCRSSHSLCSTPTIGGKKEKARAAMWSNGCSSGGDAMKIFSF